MTNSKDTLLVTKRDGRKEPVTVEKIHKVLEWAAEGLEDVSVSMVEMKSHIQLYDGITTKDIHETLIKTAADLISPEFPNYQYMAARLAIFNIRKTAYGDYEPPALKEHLERHIPNLDTNVGNKYDNRLLTQYTVEELNELNDCIDHNRDLILTYAATQQMIGKYLVQDRVTKQIYESPQMLFMLVAMAGFINYPKETRLSYVKRTYDALSKLEISLPTPIMGGLRTPTRQFSSCVTINCGDSLDSINASSNAIVDYISQRAGIGLNAGAIRALGSPIRGGEAVHTGVIPFYKLFQAAVKSCSQGALRGGAATVFYPIWHLEVESLLVLKNNKGVEDNRVRHLDYGVQISKLFYQRLISNGNITLFSPHEVADMYDAFFADQTRFEELYLKYEQDENINKKVVSAKELFSTLMLERANTGRIYIQNVDHCNDHGAFIPKVAPIEQSNLCVSGDTYVLTESHSWIPIGENVGQTLNVWNGNEWSPATFRQTGENQKLIKVSTKHSYVKCTEYHKFYLEKDPTAPVQAKDLKVGDLLIDTGRGGWNKEDYTVVSIEEVEGLHNTYCFTEPKRNMGLFNGILTGNCMEITLPTSPISAKDPTKGEISLCTLAAVNLGNIGELGADMYANMRERTELLVRLLDELLDYQDYPVEAARKSTLNRRPLGIGVINYAYWLAKQFKTYDNVALEPTHKLFEALQYYCLLASNNLAKEKGACAWFNQTKYSQGILPIDTYKEELDNIIDCPLVLEWDDLRESIKEYGLRNSTLTSQMPSECQSKDNLMLDGDGNSLSLGELLVKAGVDVETIEANGIPMRMNVTPFKLHGGRNVNEVYYNGMQEMVEIEFEDGSKYKFTNNHLLPVKTPNGVVWKRVDELTENDEIEGQPSLKILSIRQVAAEHTWDVSTNTEDYELSNGVISHNTSSQVSNSTNGIEPPRGLVSIKTSKDGILKQVVPDVDLYGPVYPLLWKLPDNTGYIQLVAVMQKFIDQSISANTNYDPAKFPNGRVPMSVMLKDLLTAYKLGVKTLYYHNTRDGADDSQTDDDGCAGGACKI